jgi:siroheme synthase
MVTGGRLVVVGTGITGVSQLTVETISWIEAADVVCYVLADPLTERWIHDHARRVEDLARLHRPDVPRPHAYRAMSERLVEHAREGRLVVGVFYGHPGVFTSPSHWAIEKARGEGIPARMLAAVSAEDCLFADLGVDPGDGACQSYEATELLIRGREPAVDAHLVIWQVGVIAAMGLVSGASHVAELVDYLLRFYPAEHVVTHYQAAQSVITEPTIERVPLAELAGLRLAVISTLYVPPLTERPYDLELARAIGLDEHSARAGEVGEPSDEVAVADWYRPISTGPSRLGGFVTSLATDPSLLAEVRADPGPYLSALGLDVIESWAFLAGDQQWINACIREGSGPAAAVALGAAATEDEARGFFVHRDGRLVRRR